MPDNTISFDDALAMIGARLAFADLPTGATLAWVGYKRLSLSETETEQLPVIEVYEGVCNSAYTAKVTGAVRVNLLQNRLAFETDKGLVLILCYERSRIVDLFTDHLKYSRAGQLEYAEEVRAGNVRAPQAEWAASQVQQLLDGESENLSDADRALLLKSDS